MQKFATKILLALTLILFFSQNIIAENPPKREFRGVWFTTGWGIDWPSTTGTSSSAQSAQKAELLQYIEALEDLNISTICFQVRSMSDAMYQSSTLPDGLQIPWSSYISGTNKRGTSPGWDPLAYVIEECHKRGIEVYAWVNPFRWASSTDQSTWSTTYDTAIKNKGWLLSYGSSTVLNPAIPEVRQHVIEVCKDIISNYQVEGIIFDDYFYPTNSSDGSGLPETSSAADYSLYQSSGTTLSIGDWRRENVDKAVQGIYDMIQETRPEVRFVAGPSPLAGASASKFGVEMWKRDDGYGYDNQYSTLYSDPLSWLNNKSVDMMATQIYWHSDHKTAPYNVLTDWWYSLAKHFDRHNCVSMNIYDFDSSMGSNQAELGNTTAHYDEHVANIQASREYAAKYGVKSTGVNFYDTRHLVSIKSGYDYQAHGEYLRDNCFQRKSINPEIHWENTPVYSAVSNLTYSSGNLSWTAASIPSGAHELTTIRYTVYAIPSSVSYENAITNDGFAGEYLQGITYSPSYTLDSDKQSGYWYAVCVFDGFGNEHDAAIYNYANGASAQTTLISPSNGGDAKWEQTFSWSAVTDATYHLQISKYENFSNILIDQPDLTSNSISINLESLVEGNTYYWKVTTQESGKIATDSEVYSFTVSSLTDAPLAQLESPSNGATLSNTATFEWSNSDEHVTSFTFQIATDATFSNIINSQDMDKVENGSNSTSFYLNSMEAGTYYWRVISKGRIYNDTPSEPYSFIIPELPTIEISLISPDNGYVISGTTQHFEWSNVEDATFLLEIAADENFNHVIITKDLTTNSYDLNIENITYSPIYYWRVTAYKNDYKDTTSETNTFLSNSEFETIDGLCIERLWNYSLYYNSSEDNSYDFPSQLGKDQRSMTAYNGKVYISYRESASSLHLLEFSGETGEYIRTIPLEGDCITGQYGANCIFVDGGGHLCISNMGTSSSNPITVCTVEISDDKATTTQVFTYALPTGARIDYANAFGDVTTTGGQIWGAVSDAGSANDNYVYKWTRNGDDWTAEYTIINKFYPTENAIGGAPWVMPLSATQFLIDGSSNYPTLYTFNANGNATYVDGFDANTSLTPTNYEGVGLGEISLGNYKFFIYSNETAAGTGYNFNIVNNPSSYDFSKMEKFWTIPKNKLGDTSHSYGLNSVATINNNDGSVTIFVYAPNNGLAAYRISLPKIDITLDAPADNATLEEDFDFSWSGVEGASYTLELSTTSTFEKIAFSATTTSTSYNSANFNLASETKYYWRVKATCENYTATTSEVRQFTSPYKESTTGDLSIEELWNYSVNGNNFPSQLGGDQRSMAAYNGNVYVIDRTTDNQCSLLEFDGKTGAYLKSIPLTGDIYSYTSGTISAWNHKPGNGIFVDGGGNLCVSCLAVSSNQKPLTVCIVDISTGNTTKIFEAELSSASYRIDYANAFGDLTKDGGQIWAATSSNGTSNQNYIYRWTRNGNNWIEEYTIATEFQPSTGTNTGIGGTPWVMPLSSSQFIVDGSYNYPTLYTFNVGGNAIYVDGLKTNSPTELKPNTIGAVGMNQITLGQYPLFIYCNETHGGAGYDFNIVHNPSSFNFSNMEYFWTIPENRLGDVAHSYGLSPIAVIKNSDNSATIYIYAPNNGLAAYRIYLPDMPITLNSPIDNVQTTDGFDFTWTGIEGATYTIELSATPTFDEIAYSATTESSMYSSYNIPSLPNSTSYYWRIKAAHDNYTTTTSAVGQFTTPKKPHLINALYYPNDKEVFNNDIVFISIKPYVSIKVNDQLLYADETVLEISKTEDFSELYFSGYQYWDEVSTEDGKNGDFLCLQRTLPISYFSNGTYYWRIRANKSGYDEAISEVRSFEVIDQSNETGSTEVNYKIKREDYEYIPISANGSQYILTNLWVRNASINDLGQSGASGDYRGFCARSAKYGDQNGIDILWVARHSSGIGYLDRYNATTGERLTSLTLKGSHATSTYPCNDVFTDDSGNLCIMNLKNTTNDILQIATVNPNTGETTVRFNLSVPERIDHASIVGDINSGEAYIIAVSAAATIYRWELYNGEVQNGGEYESTTITTFYPTNVSSFGTAARIYPIDKDYFYIDGSGSAFTLYKFGTKSPISTFAAFTDLIPSSNSGNGGSYFTHDGKSFIIYPSSSFNRTDDTINYQFTLANVSSFTEWSSASKYWTLPTTFGFGTLYNAGGDYGMLADYLQYNALTGQAKSMESTYDRTNIYLYVPGNGMAAYSLTRHVTTGADDINGNNVKLGINNSEITFGCEVENAQLYTLSGIMIGVTENASSIKKPETRGVYMLSITIDGVTTIHKIVI